MKLSTSDFVRQSTVSTLTDGVRTLTFTRTLYILLYMIDTYDTLVLVSSSSFRKDTFDLPFDEKTTIEEFFTSYGKQTTT